jgi:transcriptional regulator with XRE-family HTH domain
MIKPAELLREAMRERGTTPEDLARAVGISVRSLANLTSGSGKWPSRKSRRAVTDIFARRIWPDIPAVSGRLLRIPAGAEIEFDAAEQALEFARAFGASVTVQGRAVRFALPCRLSVSLPIASDRKNQKQ